MTVRCKCFWHRDKTLFRQDDFGDRRDQLPGARLRHSARLSMVIAPVCIDTLQGCCLQPSLVALENYQDVRAVCSGHSTFRRLAPEHNC